MSSSSSLPRTGGAAPQQDDSSRGSGFVHLNTPASIHYTAGHTVSLSALRQHKSRVECVTLPESMAVWRRAFARYVKEEGYSSFAADIEDERSGSGPILPPLVPHRAGPLRRRAGETPSSLDAFFSAPPAPPGASTSLAASAASSITASDSQTPPPISSSAVDGNSFASASSQATAAPVNASTTTTTAGGGADGIAIVSHHKIAGRQQFVYPDHDGVLSAGVVPEIVVTAEEQAEEAAARAFYISPLAMSEEELAAFEELQALWRSRARSHSFLGAQHRHAAKGTVDPSLPSTSATAEREGVAKRPRHEGLAGATGRRGALATEAAFAEAETLVEEESALDKELAEALRMADDLLRFA